MPLNDLLENIRGCNVDALVSAMAADPEAYSEAALRNEDDSLAGDGAFDLPVRVDLVQVVDGCAGDHTMVSPDKMVDFEPLTTRLGTLPLQMQPFGWDDLKVSAAFSSEPDLNRIAAWFMQWFDPEDSNEPDEHGLYRVVHYMSDPSYADGAVTFTVDLGSAPVESALDLLQTLADLGATRVAVS